MPPSGSDVEKDVIDEFLVISYSTLEDLEKDGPIRPGSSFLKQKESERNSSPSIGRRSGKRGRSGTPASSSGSAFDERASADKKKRGASGGDKVAVEDGLTLKPLRKRAKKKKNEGEQSSQDGESSQSRQDDGVSEAARKVPEIKPLTENIIKSDSMSGRQQVKNQLPMKETMDSNQQIDLNNKLQPAKAAIKLESSSSNIINATNKIPSTIDLTAAPQQLPPAMITSSFATNNNNTALMALGGGGTVSTTNLMMKISPRPGVADVNSRMTKTVTATSSSTMMFHDATSSYVMTSKISSTTSDSSSAPPSSVADRDITAAAASANVDMIKTSLSSGGSSIEKDLRLALRDSGGLSKHVIVKDAEYTKDIDGRQRHVETRHETITIESNNNNNTNDNNGGNRSGGSDGSGSTKERESRHIHQHQHQHSHQHQHFHPPPYGMPGHPHPMTHMYYSGMPVPPPYVIPTPVHPQKNPNLIKPQILHKNKWAAMHVQIARFVQNHQIKNEKVGFQKPSPDRSRHRPAGGFHAYQTYGSRDLSSSSLHRTASSSSSYPKLDPPTDLHHHRQLHAAKSMMLSSATAPRHSSLGERPSLQNAPAERPLIGSSIAPQQTGRTGLSTLQSHMGSSSLPHHTTTPHHSSSTKPHHHHPHLPFNENKEKEHPRFIRSLPAAESSSTERHHHPAAAAYFPKLSASHHHYPGGLAADPSANATLGEIAQSYREQLSKKAPHHDLMSPTSKSKAGKSMFLQSGQHHHLVDDKRRVTGGERLFAESLKSPAEMLSERRHFPVPPPSAGGPLDRGGAAERSSSYHRPLFLDLHDISSRHSSSSNPYTGLMNRQQKSPPVRVSAGGGLVSPRVPGGGGAHPSLLRTIDFPPGGGPSAVPPSGAAEKSYLDMDKASSTPHHRVLPTVPPSSRPHHYQHHPSAPRHHVEELEYHQLKQKTFGGVGAPPPSHHRHPTFGGGVSGRQSPPGGPPVISAPNLLTAYQMAGAGGAPSRYTSSGTHR